MPTKVVFVILLLIFKIFEILFHTKYTNKNHTIENSVVWFFVCVSQLAPLRLKWTKLRTNSFWVFKGRWTIFFKKFFSQKLLKSNKNSIKYHSYDICWVYVWSKFIFCARKNQKSEKIVLFTKLFFLFAKWNHKNLTIWSSMKVLFRYKLSIIDIKA